MTYPSSAKQTLCLTLATVLLSCAAAQASAHTYTAQLKAKKPVKDISSKVLVKGIKQWAAFETKAGCKKVLTVFKIT